MDLKKFIRSIPDYPKKGILFRDITTLIKNPDAFNYTVDKIIKTLSLLVIESLCTSSDAVPYSNLKSIEYLSAGNLFFFLIIINGFFNL